MSYQSFPIQFNVCIINRMSSDLLASKQFNISPTMTLTIWTSETKCSNLSLLIVENLQGKEQQYFERIQSHDFHHGKQSESILFLKLTLEGSLSSGYNNQKWVKYEKVENLIWQKVVVGKDKVDAALLQTRQRKPKKYEGVILLLSYPQHIMIVLPKILAKPNIPNLDINGFEVKGKSSEGEREAKRVFFPMTN